MDTQEKQRPRVSKYAAKRQRGEMMFGGKRVSTFLPDDSQVGHEPSLDESTPTQPESNLVGVIVSKGKRRFGFLLPQGCTKDFEKIYFHANNCEPGLFEELRVKERVGYVLKKGSRGLIANKITRI